MSLEDQKNEVLNEIKSLLRSADDELLSDAVRKYGSKFTGQRDQSFRMALAMLVSDRIASFEPCLEIAGLSLYDAEEYALSSIVCLRVLGCVEKHKQEFCLVAASSLIHIGCADYADQILNIVPDGCVFQTPAGSVLSKEIVQRQKF